MELLPLWVLSFIMNTQKNMFNRIQIHLLFLLLGIGSATAQQSLSLEECVQYALEHHKSITNANLDQQKSGHRVDETRAVGLPQVNGKVDFMANIAVQSQFLPENALNPMGDPNRTTALAFGVPYSSSASITVTQMLYNSSFFIGLEAARTYQELSAQGIQKTKEDVVANVTKAYYGVLVNDQRSELLESNKSQLERLKQDITKMYEAGLMEKIEVSKMTVSLNNLWTELDKVNSLKNISMNLLKFNMGMPMAETLALSETLEEILSRTAAETIPELNVQERIDYQMLNTQMRLNELNEKNYKFNALPSAALFGNFGANYGAIELSDIPKFNNWANFMIVGVQLDVPIFSSFRNRSLVRQSVVEQDMIQNQMEMLSDGVALENGQLKETYQNYLKAAERLEENLGLAQQVYDNAQIKYKNGVGSSYDIVVAETTLKEAQTNYLGAVYDLLITKADLNKNTGNILK